MIGRLNGKISWKSENKVIIDINGVGYMVETADVNTLPVTGENVILYIHTHVREDKIALYGFKKMEEKKLFEMLLTVSRIGPKAAINILSNLSYERFINAVLTEDIALLKEIKGIGSKTAQRLVLELQNKVDDLAQNINVEQSSKTDEELYEAVLGLGYSAREINDALSELDIKQEDILEEKIKKVLSFLGKETS